MKRLRNVPGRLWSWLCEAGLAANPCWGGGPLSSAPSPHASVSLLPRQRSFRSLPVPAELPPGRGRGWGSAVAMDLEGELGSGDADLGLSGFDRIGSVCVVGNDAVCVVRLEPYTDFTSVPLGDFRRLSTLCREPSIPDREVSVHESP